MNPYAPLTISADALGDLEKLRIATANRIRALKDEKYSADSKEVKEAEVLLDALSHAEKLATKQLERAMKAHPVGRFVIDTPSLGLKSVGRLLAVIGPPGERENPAKLWAYCGYHVIEGEAPRRRKGIQSNWNSEAKMRAYLIAEGCVKHPGPYRNVYDQAREKYAESVHPHDCLRCGPAGSPAKAGSALNLGHQHARALRLVAKRVLLDLWRIENGLPPHLDGHASCDPHPTPAVAA